MRELSKLGSLRAGVVAAVAGLALGGASSALSDQGRGGSSPTGSSTAQLITTAPAGLRAGSQPSATSAATRTVVRTVTAPSVATVPATTPKPAAPKPQSPRPQPQLAGMLGGGAVFPERTLELWPPTPVFLGAGRVHVNENGQAVDGLRVTPLTQAGAGDFGVFIVIDQNVSMSGQSLAQALAASRALAVQRTGNQELGLITFAQQPSVALGLTTDQQAITTELAHTPPPSKGSQILPALSLAYQQLANAKIAAGAVILVTDSADFTSGGPGPAELTKTGQALGIQTFAIGVRDSSYSAGVGSQLKQLNSGLIEATPAGLTNSLTQVWSALMRGYVVRYHSRTPLGSTVSVQATVDGIPGSVHLSYSTPRPRPVPPKRPQPQPRLQPLAGFSQLSPNPSFAAPIPLSTAENSGSFWSSPSSIIFVALVCALLVGLAVRVGFGAFGRTNIRSRVGSFIGEGDVDTDEAVAELDAVDRAPGLLARRRWWPSFATDVEVARFQRSPMSLVRLTAVASLVAGIPLIILIGSAAGILVSPPLGAAVLVMIVRQRARRQRARFGDQLPTYLQDMGSAIRGGRSFVSAIVAIADGADEPIRGEFERAVTDEQLGLPFEESLHTIAQRMRSEDMEQLVLIAHLHRQSGSNVAESIDRIAQGARERAELRRELTALTSQARLSSRVLTALPVFVLVGMSVIAPTYIRPILHTSTGLVILAMCGVMIVCGWMLMKRIVKVEG